MTVEKKEYPGVLEHLKIKSSVRHQYLSVLVFCESSDLGLVRLGGAGRPGYETPSTTLRCCP